MEFLKKHYEKLILSIVLLGLAVAVAALPIKVKQERQKEEERKESLIGAAVKPFPPVDLSTNKAVLTKVKTPIQFEISGRHNLFNPVPWQQRPNGEFVKVQTGNEVGIGALEVLAINPLYLKVEFTDILGNDPTNPKYQVTVIRETERSPKNSRALSVGQASPIGSIKSIQGPPENPTSLVFVLPDRTEVTISKDKSYQEVIGYSADIAYPLTGWTKKGVRKGDIFPPPAIGAETYSIVNIVKDRVIFSAKSNQKQTQKKVASAK